MTIKSKYDVVILGAGHNGLVAAAYLARAGLSVLLLEKNDYIGGATVSERIFPDFDAKLSRYSYLVSLFPEKIIRDLGLRIELRRRGTASFTPYSRNGQQEGLLLSNSSEQASRRSLEKLTGRPGAFEQLERFYQLGRTFADMVWGTMLEPLRSKAEFRLLFQQTEAGQAAWRSLVEEPLGIAIERELDDDLLRGIVCTDAKIGLLTHPHDPTLLQNRCFLYHIMGNRTGEWRVPVGGMGQLVEELKRAAAGAGAEMLTRARVTHLHLPDERTAKARLSAAVPSGEAEGLRTDEPSLFPLPLGEGQGEGERCEGLRTIQFDWEDSTHTVEAEFVLLNFGPNVLAQVAGLPFQRNSSDEGAVLKINMLLKRLPRFRARGVEPAEAFCGTVHIDEGYQQMQESYRQAVEGKLPSKVPCEIYCHTLTDNSILSSELNAAGFHTLTLFALDTPWRLFAAHNPEMRAEAASRCLAGMNAWLEEPIEECLARSPAGEPCLEVKSPVDIESELGHDRGNIFHRALAFPFADSTEATNTWGVETAFKNVFICGASACRGGAVSGIPGHNAAMKVLELKRMSGAPTKTSYL